MKTVKEIIPEIAKDVKKRAFRDFGMNRLDQHILDGILASIKKLEKIAKSILQSENKEK